MIWFFSHRWSFRLCLLCSFQYFRLIELVVQQVIVHRFPIFLRSIVTMFRIFLKRFTFLFLQSQKRNLRRQKRFIHNILGCFWTDTFRFRVIEISLDTALWFRNLTIEIWFAIFTFTSFGIESHWLIKSALSKSSVIEVKFVFF